MIFLIGDCRRIPYRHWLWPCLQDWFRNSLWIPSSVTCAESASDFWTSVRLGCYLKYLSGLRPLNWWTSRNAVILIRSALLCSWRTKLSKFWDRYCRLAMRDLSQTNGISDPPNSHVVTHNNSVNKIQADVGFCSRHINQRYPKTFTVYHHLQHRCNETRRDPYEELVFDRQQPETCTNFSECLLCPLPKGHITQRPSGQS